MLKNKTKLETYFCLKNKTREMKKHCSQEDQMKLENKISNENDVNRKELGEVNVGVVWVGVDESGHWCWC